MNKAELEMKGYKEKYKIDNNNYELFVEIFLNEEVSDDFLNTYGNHQVEIEEKHWYDEETTIRYTEVWVVFFKTTILSKEKLDKFIKHPDFYHIHENASLTEELILYLLKEKTQELDFNIQSHITANTALTDEKIIENIDFVETSALIDDHYDRSSDLVDFLIEKGYAKSVKEFQLAGLKTITVDFIKKYEKEIQFSNLSANDNLSKEVCEYLIEKHPEKVNWWVILEHITPTYELVLKYQNFIFTTISPGYVLSEYTVSEEKLVSLILDLAYKMELEFDMDVDWENASLYQILNFEQFSKYYEKLDAEIVLKNQNIKEEELEKMKIYHQLKTLFQS